MPDLPPLYQKSSGYWNNKGQRVVNIFHRDIPGEVVLQVVGSHAELVARFLVERQDDIRAMDATDA